jgi:hypothetical protein
MVGVNISAHFQQMRVGFNAASFKNALDQSAGPGIFSIKVHCITRGHFLQEFCDSAIGMLLEQQMKVVRHEAISDDIYHRVRVRVIRKIGKVSAVKVLPIIKDDQTVREALIVVIVKKDLSFIHPPIVNMIDPSVRKKDVSHKAVFNDLIFNITILVESVCKGVSGG